MCDVVFITPNMDGSTSSEAMGTLQLVSILKEKNISCDVLQFFRIGDLANFDAFVENAIRMIDERKPKIVSFYTRCDVYHIDLRLAERIKSEWKDIYIVCGGPQSDITSKETIEQIPFIDFVCCGEGESTIYPFFSSLLRNDPDLSVPGLVYRLDGKVVQNSRPKLIDNLDILPLMDYSLLSFIDQKKQDAFPIEVGRGCPFGCTFCSTNSFWGRKYRLKSPERIYLEIKDAYERYGVTKFKFTHDMFTLNRNKVIETCKLLKTLDFPIEWGGSSRLDCIDPELIDVLADAGMKGIFLGIETGSPRMQKIINKNLKLDNAVELVEYCESKGIKVTASFMYGFPEETEEDLSQTLALMGKLLNLNGVRLSPHLCAFFVGTEMSAKYADEMSPVDYYSNETGAFAVEECKDLIQGHPELFTHMLEYKTELRQKLEHFEVFLNMWKLMQPVYQYLSEKYPQDRLIDMYYDFVDANRSVLEKVAGASMGQQCFRIVLEDMLPKHFESDENYDIIKDFYRLKLTEYSKAVRSGETVSAVFGFNPEQIKKVPLEQYERCNARVTWENKKRSVVCTPLN